MDVSLRQYASSGLTTKGSHTGQGNGSTKTGNGSTKTGNDNNNNDTQPGDIGGGNNSTSTSTSNTNTNTDTNSGLYDANGNKYSESNPAPKKTDDEVKNLSKAEQAAYFAGQLASSGSDVLNAYNAMQKQIIDNYNNHNLTEAQFRNEEAALLKAFEDAGGNLDK